MCNTLWEVWCQDVIERLEYERERKNGTRALHKNWAVLIVTVVLVYGSIRGNRWNAITVRMGMWRMIIKRTLM